MEYPDKIYVTGRYVHFADSVFSLTADGERTVLAKDSPDAVEFTRSNLVTELADALEGVLRIVAAASLSQSLGQNQLKRVAQAKAALRKLGR